MLMEHVDAGLEPEKEKDDDDDMDKGPALAGGQRGAFDRNPGPTRMASWSRGLLSGCWPTNPFGCAWTVVGTFSIVLYDGSLTLTKGGISVATTAVKAPLPPDRLR